MVSSTKYTKRSLGGKKVYNIGKWAKTAKKIGMKFPLPAKGTSGYRKLKYAVTGGKK